MFQLVRLSRIRILACLALSLILTGCGISEMRPFASKSLDSITLFERESPITIGGPIGFCVNKRQSRTNATSSIVILGPCEIDKSQAYQQLGLFIASVSLQQSEMPPLTPAEFEKFLGSPRGQSLLSNSGDASRVEVLDTVTTKRAFYIHIRDQSDPLIPETSNEVWRGFFTVSGRVVSISMINFIEKPISGDRALEQLRAFAARILELNSDS